MQLGCGLLTCVLPMRLSQCIYTQGRTIAYPAALAAPQLLCDPAGLLRAQLLEFRGASQPLDLQGPWGHHAALPPDHALASAGVADSVIVTVAVLRK